MISLQIIVGEISMKEIIEDKEMGGRLEIIRDKDNLIVGFKRLKEVKKNENRTRN